MSSTGKGRLYRTRRYSTLRGRIGLPDVTAPARTVANDTFWGGFAPTSTQIPYDWLTPPARWRSDQPRNVATVTRTGGTSARAVNATSVAAVGERPFAATLDTLVIDDPGNYATWVVGNYSAPRQRMPQLRLELLSRTPTECWLILERQIGDRISITGAPSVALGSPSPWPDGLTELVIEGIEHSVDAAGVRRVVWNTAPIIGATAGRAGPWFRADESATSGSDLLAF
jgi:hypothetical protein